MTDLNGHRPDLEEPITMEEATEFRKIWLKEVPWFSERYNAAHAAIDQKYDQWVYDTVNASIEGGNDLRRRGLIAPEVSEKEHELPHA